jgi:hypothetical protein
MSIIIFINIAIPLNKKRMRTNLIKIEKLVTGTAQLFTAMDKGFAKVESDLTLLTRFRMICFEANQKLENVLPQLRNHIQHASDWDDDLNSAETFNKMVFADLLTIKNIIGNNIISLSEYIDDFSELWKKSFSLSALLKFKFLLINEFSLLDREIQKLEMEHLLKERTKLINLHQTAKKITEDTGL